MARTRSFSGLNWVRGEIDEVIRHARDALEEYVEGGGEPRVLGPCINQLSQARGVLEMLQIHGAARLADEMRMSAQAMADKQVGNTQEAAEALMLSLIQLPDYLEKLEAGGEDIPLLLLPSINDLRASRGAPPITESNLLISGIARTVGKAVSDQASRKQLRLAAYRVRPNLHRGLVGWFRDSDAQDGLGRLRDVFAELARLSDCEPMLRGVFRTAHAVIEGLLDNSIEAGNTVKGLVGRVDRITKELEKHGVRKAVASLPQDVVKDLLEQVVRSDSDHPVIRAVKTDYELDNVLPDELTLAQARARMFAPNADALAGMRAAAVKELMPIKDTLDLYMRGGRDKEQLVDLESPMRRLASTLGMAGMDDLAERLTGRADDIQSIGSGAVEADDTLLMRIAGDLLFVESSLDNVLVHSGGGQEGSAGDVPRGEMRSLVNRTLEEASVDMAKAKESIIVFLENPADTTPLAVTPALLHGVAGALRVISHAQAADMLDRVSGFIQMNLLEHHYVPSSQVLDSLAETLSGVEYYMEAVAEGRQDAAGILEIPAAALETLESPAADKISWTGDDAPQAESQTPSLEPEVPVQTDVLFPPAAADIDPEIMEIFLEEAHEEEEVIQEHFERWRKNTDDDRALDTFRRSFHTLKGSGRLAGASSISEYAWSVENLLNRLIDQTLAPNERIIRHLDEVIEALPELISAQELKRAPALDVRALIEQGEALVEDRTPELVDAVPVEPGQIETGTELPGGRVELSIEDSELLDIFQTEAHEHLAYLDGYMERCKVVEGCCPVDSELIRALHTLAGSARMTGVAPLADIAKALELKGNRLLETDTGADADYIGLLSDGVGKMGDILAVLGMGVSVVSDPHELLQHIEAYVPGGETHAEEPGLPFQNLQELPETESTGESHTDTDEISEPRQAEPVDLDLIGLGDTLEAGEEIILEQIDSASWDADAADPLLEQIPFDEVEYLDAKEMPALDTFAGEQDAVVSGQTQDRDLTLSELASSTPSGMDLDHDQESALDDPGLQKLEAREQVSAAVLDEGTDHIGVSLDDLAEESTEAVQSDFPPLQATEPDVVDGEPEPALEIADSDGETAADGRPEDGLQVSIDPELRGIFLEESQEILDRLDDGLRSWDAQPDNNEHANQLQRALHTLKGSARLSGIAPIGDLSHALENLVQGMRDTEAAATAEQLNLAQKVVDQLSDQVEAVRIGHPVPLAEVLLNDLSSALRALQVASPTMPDASLDAQGRIPTEDEGEVISGDPELIEIFLEEARDLLDQLDADLHEWTGRQQDQDIPIHLKRTLHTLKGSSRLAGIQSIGNLAHALETLLDGITPDKVRSHASIMPLAQRAADNLSEQIDEVGRGGPVQLAGTLINELENVHAELGGIPVDELAAGRSPAPAMERTGATGEVAPAQAAGRSPTLQEQVRVRSDLLNRLVNNAGEISIYRARLEQQNTVLGFNLGELEQTVTRLNDQLRQMDIETEAQILYRYEQEREEGGDLEDEFDPLELDRFSTIQQLSRSLIETVNDLSSIRSLLDDQQKEAETLLLQQSRISNDLQDGLLRTRMVPFSHLVPRLHRLVRQTANSLGKRAVLEVFGAEGEMDRGILDRMLAPMEHILRNAVSHGIEKPKKRRAAGKDETGKISVYITRDGNDVVITVSDDGAGLNLPAIRKKAIERGLLKEGAKVDDDDVMQLVLEPGFSTVKEVTQISGRGVGTDVVVSEVKQLGGTLDIESQPGRGTGFSIRLPFTLAISEALLVALGDEIYAVPHVSIEGVVRIGFSELIDCYDGHQPGFKYAGHDYQVRYLGDLLGTHVRSIQEGQKWLPLLLVRSGEHRIAIQVDQVMGNRQIVIKSVGAQLSTVRWISGGTILADGRVALILDVSALVRMDVVHSAQTAQPVVEEEAIGRMQIMVVDDSITVRKVTERLLKRHNMDVITAKDGVDAVALLQDQRPDVMLLDVEMPRMDGYELARHMRSSSELNDIPIIMITSRSGAKHREMALSLGVKRYLGKPYQEGDLLDNIYSVLAETEAGV